MSRRIVVTGMGVVSPLGNDADSVATSLREGRSGLRAMPEYAEMGLRSQVAGVPEIDLEGTIDRKLKRFMGDAAAYAYVSMRDAIADAGLSDQQVRDPRTGVTMLIAPAVVLRPNRVPCGPLTTSIRSISTSSPRAPAERPV